MEFYRPALLDLDKHNRKDFDCGVPEYNEWLTRYAGQNRRRDNAATWVIADAEYRVASYATLSMTSIDRGAAPSAMAKGAPKAVPALLIGRLATDVSVTGLSLGTQLVKHMLATAAEINVKAACRAVVVTALDDAAFTWWQRLGFVSFDPEDSTDLDMFLLTGDIQTTLGIGG